MAEYPIYAKIDPSGVTQGSAKVKQELQGISSAASATQTAIDRAFDQAAFDRSIGALISRLDNLEKGLVDITTSNNAVAKSNASVAKSLDQVAASAAGAGRGLTDEEKAARAAAKAQRELESSMERVLKVTDQEALELQKLNQLLSDAKRLMDAGKISHEQYARVQALVDQGMKRNVVSLGQQRAGYTQLGFQVQDITQTLALGINPLTVLAQQGGQTASALSMALGPAGAAGKAATFMAGPWGSLIIAAGTILGGFAVRALMANDAVSEGVKKLQDDAKEAENSRKAREAFTRTIEGQIEAQRKLNDELDRSIRTQRQEQQLTLFRAQQSVGNQERSRPGLVGQIARQQGLVNNYRDQLLRPGFGTDPEAQAGIAIVAARAEKELDRLKQQLRDLDNSIASGQRAVREAEVPLLQSSVEASLDKRAAATLRYTQALGRLNQQLAIGAGRQGAAQEMQADGSFRRVAVQGISREQYQRELTRITRQRDDAIKAAQESARQERQGPLTSFISPVEGGRITSGFGPRAAPTAGASTFHRGIDIAAPTGTAVRAAASGVVVYAGKLPGLGNAIIVDHGGGTITEYGHLSSILTQKNTQVSQGQNIGAVGSTGISTGPHLDYRVKVGGRYVDPRGANFRTDPDSTAVRAANAAQAAQEAAARKAEQERDFVQGVVDEAAARGVGGQAETLQARIDRVLADFNRRFNRAANDNEKGQISSALTDADARETRQRFEDSYVKPLERLRALQGKTGLDREVLNKQLEETQRLGRELTPVEAQQIANSVRRGDALQREAQVLAQVRQPLEEYRAQIALLNELLAKGAINQTTYNARIADLGAGARGVLRDMPGRDPGTGQTYGTLADRADEDARYVKERDDLQNNREQLLAMGVDYDALEEAAAKRHADNLRKIDQARYTTALSSAQSTADSLVSIAENLAGKQSGVYKAMFVASKAFAIAESVIKIQQGIANAFALPFPANLAAVATVAAQAASIVSNIQAISLNLADGGYVSGPGTGRSDSIPANLSNGEFVVNAQATSANRALLEALNSGRPMAAMRPASNDNRSQGAARMSVSVRQYPGVDVETRESPSTGEVEVIARRAARQEAEPAVARALANPNSRVSKAVTRNTLAGRRRT